MASATTDLYPSSPATAGEEPLDLEAFGRWLAATTGADRPISPEEAIEELVGGDQLARLRLACALDALGGGEAVPLAELHEAKTVRELHLHYLYVLALPKEAGR